MTDTASPIRATSRYATTVPSQHVRKTTETNDLPAPNVSISADGMTDALASIYRSIANLRNAQTATSTTMVGVTREKRLTAERERQAALDKAREEAEKGGLFKWLSDDMGVLGVAGLATFNWAAVGADLAIHKLDLVDKVKVDVLDAAILLQGRPELIAADILLRKLDVAPEAVTRTLDKLGLGKDSCPGISDDDVKPVVDKAIMVNLMICGAAASALTAGSTTALVIAMVGVALSTGGMVVQETGGPQWLSLGLQIAGAATSGASGFVGSAAKLTAQQAAQRAAGAIIQGTTDVVKGTDKVISTIHQHAADKAQVTAEQRRHTLMKLDRLLSELVESLKESDESHQRACSTLTDTMSTHNKTLISISAARY